MAYSKYYRKYSAGENNWSKIIARIIWALMVFFIVLGIEIALIVLIRSEGNYHSRNLLVLFVEQLNEEGFSAVGLLQDWRLFILPVLFSVMTLIYPNALRTLQLFR